MSTNLNHCFLYDNGDVQSRDYFFKQALIYFLIAIEYLFAFFLSHIFTGLSTTLVDLTSIWEYQNFSENVINHYLQPRFKLFILFVFLMGLYVLNKLFRFSFNEKGVFFKSIQKGNRNISRKKIYIQVCFCGFIAFIFLLALLYLNLQHTPGALTRPNRQYSFNFFSLQNKFFYINLYLSFFIYAKLWLGGAFFIHLAVCSALTLKEK